MSNAVSYERIGVYAVALRFELGGWAFWEDKEVDYGIDARVEPRRSTGAPSGKAVALQIKGGPSWFAKRARGGWRFEAPRRNFLDWLGHGLAVVVVLYDPEADAAYWAHVTTEKVHVTKKGWWLLVPQAQRLGPQAWEQLSAIATEAPGASEDVLEYYLDQVPPTTAQRLRSTSDEAASDAVRLAALLAKGNHEPATTAQLVLDGEPGWLASGAGMFEAAVGSYAVEHGHPKIASLAFRRAAQAGCPEKGLLARAALCASVADPDKVADLLDEAERAGEEPLSCALVRALIEHGDKPGLPPIPPEVEHASREELAREPACLNFLATTALMRDDVTAAIEYARQLHEARPESSAAQLLLAQGLQQCALEAPSGVADEDWRAAEQHARAALEQRRRWDGPSGEALVLLQRQHLLAGAFTEVVRLATPAPDGEATEREASSDEVILMGAVAALGLGDRRTALAFAERGPGTRHEATLAALLADDSATVAEQVRLWLASLESDPLPDSKLRALLRLASLDALPEKTLLQLHRQGFINELFRDLILAHRHVARGDLAAALERLRRHRDSPLALEFQVDLLTSAGRLDEALRVAGLAYDRFGASALGRQKLALLSRVGLSEELVSHAHELLSKPDMRSELRPPIHRALIIHYARQGEWPKVARCCHSALAEATAPDLQWTLVEATLNQGRADEAWALMRRLEPPVLDPRQSALWVRLHARFGFTEADVKLALDYIESWPDLPEPGGQILTVLLFSGNALTPAGVAVLPEIGERLSARFQDVFHTYMTRHPDGPLRRISGSPEQLAAWLRTLLATNEAQHEMLRTQVRAGRLPMGMLASQAQRPYTQTLLDRTVGIVLAVNPNVRIFAKELANAEAALDKRVCLDTSTLAVATLMPGRWEQLRCVFADVHLSRDASDDLELSGRLLRRAHGSTFTIGYDRSLDALIEHEFTLEEYHDTLVRLAAIEQAVKEVTVMATPDLEPLKQHIRHARQEVWLTPIALARKLHLPLWSDDVAVRNAAAELGIPTFGTFALLQALVEGGRIPDSLREDAMTLARNYVVDVDLTPDETAALAREHNWQRGPASALITRPLFWVAPQSGLRRFMALIESVHTHAPAAVPAWFVSACIGLGTITEPHRREQPFKDLANLVISRINLDEPTQRSLVDLASHVAANYPQPLQKPPEDSAAS